MKSLENLLDPFTGYLFLRMFEEAQEELANVPEEFKNHPKVREAELALLMEMKRWEEGVTLGETLLLQWPNELEFYFKTAYCHHELRRTAAAKEILMKAPSSIRQMALFSYNLACYEAQLGNLEAAKQLLATAFTRDPRFRETFRGDLDLKPLWGMIDF